MLTGEAREIGLQRWAGYAHNPRAFVYDLFGGVELEDYQADILERIAHGKDVTVRSGHGVGKTTTDAFAVFHYLLTRPLSKIPTTAPTFRQVKDILWAEIAKWYTRFRLKAHLDLQTTKMAVVGRESEWFAIGVASNKPENIEGFHAPHVLFVVDEAKGVRKAIYDSIDGALTTGGQRLYTSTPGSRAGQFYESHFGRIAKFFDTIHINGEKSRRVNARWREQKAEEWGVDSPIYQAKVLGEFPSEGDDILIRLDYILAAEAAFEEERCSKCQRLEACGCGAPSVPALAHQGPKVLGVDVARYGMDETACAGGSKTRIDAVKSWAGRDLVTTTQRVIGFIRDPDAIWPDAISVAVDDTGLGGGVTDMLGRIHMMPNMPIIFGSNSLLDTPDRKEHFRNNKAFLAWKLRKTLEENYNARERGELGTYALPNVDKLKGQLSNLRIRHTPKNQIQIIDPDDPTIPIADLPKGVRVSPDHAHALMIQHHGATTSAGIGAGAFVPPSPAPERPERRRVSSFIFGGPRR